MEEYSLGVGPVIRRNMSLWWGQADGRIFPCCGSSYMEKYVLGVRAGRWIVVYSHGASYALKLYWHASKTLYLGLNVLSCLYMEFYLQWIQDKSFVHILLDDTWPYHPRWVLGEFLNTYQESLVGTIAVCSIPKPFRTCLSQVGGSLGVFIVVWKWSYSLSM